MVAALRIRGPCQSDGDGAISRGSGTTSTLVNPNFGAKELSPMMSFIVSEVQFCCSPTLVLAILHIPF